MVSTSPRGYTSWPGVINVDAETSTPLVGREGFAQKRGVLLSVEGLWGAGKSTIATALGQRMSAAGFMTTVLHYGPRPGVIGRLSHLLETAPLRSREGLGGYAHPHHATVDVLLRLCREAYHHTHLYRPALTEHDVVVIDHGVYAKLAYALAVLSEQHPEAEVSVLVDQVRACAAPWFLHPDRAIFLDMPWPLARERAIERGHGGGNPGSLERLLFLPRYAAAYRHVTAAHSGRVHRIRVGLRDVASVLAEIEDDLVDLLHTPLGAVDV
ncbi:MAG: hypothetical protein HYR62_02960 [Actinobacteria bacterium]|nr:hypothetical protein [Actinomycetota bacterium]MBI3687430.1 hypothetical protein [Actinomycetota bacterium]